MSLSGKVLPFPRGTSRSRHGRAGSLAGWFGSHSPEDDRILQGGYLRVDIAKGNELPVWHTRPAYYLASVRDSRPVPPYLHS